MFSKSNCSTTKRHFSILTNFQAKPLLGSDAHLMVLSKRSKSLASKLFRPYCGNTLPAAKTLDFPEKCSIARKALINLVNLVGDQVGQLAPHHLQEVFNL